MAAADGVWSPDRRRLTLGLTLTISFVASEALAVSTVLPKIKDDLDGIELYGWVMSAFFLGTMVGIVVAGQSADRLGAAPAFTLGLVLFVAGLLAGGIAPSMLVLVLARAVQGFGAGAVPAIGYFCIGRSYPDSLKPRMFAVLATAWVVPGVLGPVAASLIEHAFGWRWVFLALVPLVITSGFFTLPAMRPIGPGAAHPDGPAVSRLPVVLLAAAGAAALLSGLGNLSSNLPLGVGLLAVGLPLTWVTYRRLVPPGTLTARPGLPAAILARGSLTFAFFGVDGFVPLALAEVRGLDPLLIGVSVTLTTLAWTTAAWVQERLVQDVGARRLVMAGHAIVLVSVGVTALGLFPSVPLAVPFAGWTLGGFGIGLAYAPISLTVLRSAEEGREGAISASLQLTEQLGIALGIGAGGAAIKVGHGLGWTSTTGIAIAWAIGATVALAGVVIATRLPGPVPAEVPA